MGHRLDPKLYRPIAWDPSVLVEAGVPGDRVAGLLADGPRATPERPRLSLQGRKRGQPTVRYVWGPDLRFLLGGG